MDKPWGAAESTLLLPGLSLLLLSICVSMKHLSREQAGTLTKTKALLLITVYHDALHLLQIPPRKPRYTQFTMTL